MYSWQQERNRWEGGGNGLQDRCSQGNFFILKDNTIECHMLTDIMFWYKAYNGPPLFLHQECIEVRDGEIKRIKAQLLPQKVNSNLTYSTYVLYTCTLSLCMCTFVCSTYVCMYLCGWDQHIVIWRLVWGLLLRCVCWFCRWKLPLNNCLLMSLM